MKYYEVYGESVLIGYSQTDSDKEGEPDYREISEDEYTQAIQKLEAEMAAIAEKTEQTLEERIAELEAENAALLYQVLTGEEFDDV